MTCAGVVETITVCRVSHSERGGWSANRPCAHFAICWTRPDGKHVQDRQVFDMFKLLEMQVGVVPMVTTIYCPEMEEHPKACILALAYLVRVDDQETGARDVVARLLIRDDPHGYDPEDEFFVGGALAESGRNIYPLPIHDL